MELKTKAIAHYGILGQRWGIRKKEETKEETKKETIDDINSKDRIIKKGTSLQTVTNREIDLSKESRIYTSYTDYDKAMYRAIMPSQYSDKGDKAYENRFLIKKDIRVPSDKKLVETFLKLAKEDPDAVARDLAIGINKQSLFGMANAKLIKKKFDSIDLDNPEGKEAKKLAKKFITYGLMTSESERSANRFYANLLKEGYDAMSDLNDRRQISQDPLIIFNRTKLTKTSSLKLTNDDINNYFAYAFSKENEAKEKDLSSVQHSTQTKKGDTGLWMKTF